MLSSESKPVFVEKRVVRYGIVLRRGMVSRMWV